ncbi:hypothetical protein SESBI_01171 [Sesbania bispinosa]|nr:hypothetical protein SESBI_01171 [Sesbania bispinosa]
MNSQNNTSSKLPCWNRSSLLAEIDHPLPTSHTQMKIHHLHTVEAGSAKVIHYPFEISFCCGIIQLQNRFVADDFGVVEGYLEPWAVYPPLLA